MGGRVGARAAAEPHAPPVALITGASRGIGERIAHALAGRGCDLVLAARSRDALREVADAVATPLSRSLVVPVDLTEPDASGALVRAAIERFDAIDVLICCAGVMEARALSDCDDAAIDRTMQINLLAPMRLCREAAREMKRRGSGRIVLVSSMFAFVSASGYSLYSASKAGLVGFAKSLAVEYARDGIRVNVVAPGHIRTAMIEGVLAEAGSEERLARNTPMRRVADPDEVARAVEFLALDAPDYLTGDVMMLDGGYTCR